MKMALDQTWHVHQGQFERNVLGPLGKTPWSEDVDGGDVDPILGSECDR